MEEEAEKYPDINFVAMTGDFAAISGLDSLQRLCRRLPGRIYVSVSSQA